jgi:hypothetical protein
MTDKVVMKDLQIKSYFAISENTSMSDELIQEEIKL